MFFSLSETLSNFMAMVGLINRSSLVSMIRTIVFLATFYFAFKFQGLNGVIILKTVLGAIECILLFELSRRFVRLPGLTLPRILWRPLVSAASMVFVLSLLPHWADSSPFFILVIKAFTGAVTYASVSLLLWLIARRPDGIESLAIDIVLSKFSARLSTH
jgi:hypothetical protein